MILSLTGIRKFILFFLAITALASVCFAKSEDITKLPQPPGSRFVFEDKAVHINDIDVHGIQLKCNINPQEIAVFYQNMLGQRGWKLAYAFEKQGVMSFTDEGGGYLYVSTVPGLDGNTIYVLESPKDLSICRTLQDYFFKPEMAADAPGKDIPDVPRYPNARRRLSVFTQREGEFLLYETDATPHEVGSFYRQMLSQYGWEPISALNPDMLLRFTEAKNALKDVALVFYERGDENIFIAAYQTPRKVSKSRTLITIMKNFGEEFFPDVGGE